MERRGLIVTKHYLIINNSHQYMLKPYSEKFLIFHDQAKCQDKFVELLGSSFDMSALSFNWSVGVLNSYVRGDINISSICVEAL